MSLDEITSVHIRLPGDVRADGHGELFDLDRDYGTLAFGLELMQRLIGHGQPIVDPAGNFLGFDARQAPGQICVGMWLAFVPPCYREDVSEGTVVILKRMRGCPIHLDERHGHPLIEYIDELRLWIATHVWPTDDLRPRSVRYGSMWAEIGIQAAFDQGRIPREQAHRMTMEVRHGR